MPQITRRGPAAPNQSGAHHNAQIINAADRQCRGSQCRSPSGPRSGSAGQHSRGQHGGGQGGSRCQSVPRRLRSWTEQPLSDNQAAAPNITTSHFDDTSNIDISMCAPSSAKVRSGWPGAERAECARPAARSGDRCPGFGRFGAGPADDRRDPDPARTSAPYARRSYRRPGLPGGGNGPRISGGDCGRPAYRRPAAVIQVMIRRAKLIVLLRQNIERLTIRDRRLRSVASRKGGRYRLLPTANPREVPRSAIRERAAGESQPAARSFRPDVRRCPADAPS